MVDGCAEGVWSAGPLHTGVRTRVVGQLTVLDVGAVVVHLALQDRHADSYSKSRDLRASGHKDV